MDVCVCPWAIKIICYINVLFSILDLPKWLTTLFTGTSLMPFTFWGKIRGKQNHGFERIYIFWPNAIALYLWKRYVFVEGTRKHIFNADYIKATMFTIIFLFHPSQLQLGSEDINSPKIRQGLSYSKMSVIFIAQKSHINKESIQERQKEFNSPNREIKDTYSTSTREWNKLQWIHKFRHPIDFSFGNTVIKITGWI